MTKKDLKDKLLEKVLDQIKLDLQDGIEDTILEMLKNCTNRSLIHFLHEDDWDEFKTLEND
jgi:hypothetical protein